ncbi:MBL fold metallo-hydrolase RNA specificity domain-containing protein [Luteitalea sp.]|jgi:metallo-beta-lactamase family protein|uniref:MBL fold metallo-hydrolase RNA specificity domain-containing protein n=1 Tax=Luteitalea sp. TaxID=2004800 RepID=UPI0037C84173
MSALTFLGAAQTVTGSRHLLRTSAGHRVLVDCGMFQGLKSLRERNWQGLGIAPAEIDAVLLTHAHLDHVGWLPRLVAAGYRGRVYCTPGTRDLCTLVLPDAGRIQEEDARQANKHHYTKHTPAKPLFTEDDARRALTLLQPVGYGVPLPIVPGLTAEFIRAGHLLGSSFIRVTQDEAPHTILFGGDLGRYGRPVLPDPEPVDEADVLLIESTYGNRTHQPDDDGASLAEVVVDTHARGGRLVIPSFAIGRVEELLYWLQRLEKEGRIPSMPTYVDSPMAAEALRFYSSRPDELDPDMRPIHRGPMFDTRRLHVIKDTEESKALTNSSGPAVIISSSGMATGGRVLHHLKRLLPDARNTVLFVGYQAAGTRGRLLVDGADTVKIHGEVIPVAARVVRNDQMSAHADRDEILRWLGGFKRAPGRTFLVHGEPEAMGALATTITSTLGWNVHQPQHRETVEL